MMRYRETEYALVHIAEHEIWQWSASVAGVVITGQQPTKPASATAAEKAIDRTLCSLKKGFNLRAEPD
jgi:hypothetical protein